MKTVEKYLKGLKNAYFEIGEEEGWEHFESIKHGAKKEDIIELKKEYPLIPDSLVKLLEYVDGTYFREYEGETIVFYFLGSDVEEYPYYLLSCEQILKNKDIAEKYSDYIERAYEEDGVEIDKRITSVSDGVKWLHFSDCMNNGGTSRLFIDFTPSESGKVGQVLRFLHDPDEIMVIADSFDDYLKMLMEDEYAFINEDIM